MHSHQFHIDRKATISPSYMKCFAYYCLALWLRTLACAVCSVYSLSHARINVIGFFFVNGTVHIFVFARSRRVVRFIQSFVRFNLRSWTNRCAWVGDIAVWHIDVAFRTHTKYSITWWRYTEHIIKSVGRLVCGQRIAITTPAY